MKKETVLLALLAAAGFAAHAESFVDRARVQDVQPQYETVQVPRNECSTQWVAEPRAAAAGTNYGGAIIGGVAGALVGNQVGRGHGREAATAAGAVIGALAGNSVAQRGLSEPGYEQRQVQSCRTVSETQTQITGYRVTYEYHGNQYTTFTREQPGATLPVRVSVAPVEAEYHRR